MVKDIPWSDILPAAIAVAISPVPIMAVILALFSQHARRNGAFFLAGWVLGLVVITDLVLLLADASSLAAADTPSRLAGAIKLGLGVVFIVFAFWQWQRRPPAGEVRPLPAWTAKIEGFSAAQTLMLAFGLSVVNPKNVALTLAAVLAVAEAGLPAAQTWLALLIYIVLGSVTIAIPVFYRLFAGARAGTQLAAWKEWLQHNNATAMLIVLLVIGTVLVGKGLEGIL